MSQVRSLERLPVEILQRIVGYLTAISAFDFLLVCRNIYNACDDWTVWRAIVKASLDLPAGSPNSKEITKGMWKRFAVADMKADQASHVDNVTAWLPQMMALHRRLFHCPKTMVVSRLLTARTRPIALDNRSAMAVSTF